MVTSRRCQQHDWEVKVREDRGDFSLEECERLGIAFERFGIITQADTTLVGENADMVARSSAYIRVIK